ncbi:hypothetical protein L1Z18_20440, partial [Acinetobacter baumannii]|nr:hypothetical protein [Acinetobacter baumannii]
EWVHVQLHQQKGMISLSPPTICNSANYLDLKSIAALETMMKSYAGTIIFVSHDKQLVDNIADIIYEIKDHKIIKTFERDC